MYGKCSMNDRIMLSRDLPLKRASRSGQVTKQYL